MHWQDTCAIVVTVFMHTVAHPKHLVTEFEDCLDFKREKHIFVGEYAWKLVDDVGGGDL
jgi:hypothetical protein